MPLYEAGEQDGTVYIVTRWVEGTELGTLIHEDGPLEPARAARTAAQIADALEIAHEKGLVHRDVKPSNVILTPEDHVYLTDFGLAKRAETDPGLDRRRPDARRTSTTSRPSRSRAASRTPAATSTASAACSTRC